jgi:hypothetical protein
MVLLELAGDSLRQPLKDLFSEWFDVLAFQPKAWVITPTAPIIDL